MTGDNLNKADAAAECFNEAFNCAQAVFSAFAPDLGLDREAALKVAAAFGGGVAGTGATCGAVTGALMALGLSCGMEKAEDKQAKEETNRLAVSLMERFMARNSSVLCRELLGCDLSSPEAMKFFKEQELRDRLCAVFVRDAAEILEELLASRTEARIRVKAGWGLPHPLSAGEPGDFNGPDGAPLRHVRVRLQGLV